MRTKLMIYNKYRQSVEAFEQDVQDFVAGATEITGLQVVEHHNSDLIFNFQLGTERRARQSICILSGIDLNKAESIINATLEAAEQTGKQGKFLNIVALSKSPRMLAVMVLAQADAVVEAVNGEGSAQGQAEVQDAGLDAKSKRGAKRKGVNKN